MINSINRSLVSGKKWYRNISAGNPLYSEMELIATAYGTGSSRLITFASIPSDYKHLQIRAAARSTNASSTDFLAININSVDSSSYSQHSLAGNGSSVSSSAATSQTYINFATIPAASAIGNTHSGLVLDLLDYTSTSKNKTLRCFAGMATTTTLIQLVSGGFFNTSAVTRLDIVTASGNFTSDSRVSLYGIKG